MDAKTNNSLKMAIIIFFGFLMSLFCYYLISDEFQFIDSFLVIIPSVLFTFIILNEYRVSYQGKLSFATVLTILRGYISALLLIPIVVESFSKSILTIFSVLYGMSVVLDYIDGRLARRRDSVTDFGSNLDVRFDSLAILLVSLLLVLSSTVHPVYLIVGVAGYLFNLYLYIRENLGYKIHSYENDKLGRKVAALQMAYATVALSPVLSGSLSINSSLLVTSITVYVFLRDFLSVSGLIGS